MIEANDAVDAIERTAERLGVSLICLGSHGRSRVVNLLLGSLATSRRPVLVIPVGRQ